VLVLLEVDGFHVPTDIAGGLLLALLAAETARRRAYR
jgi:membrane-associated phospholipid phosphatase